ncbi:hypothetical protein HYY72_02610 [Candidatus Woesearchaeota archaeon]|nr:hypothetical protein [Candidatus Woesearchaeota archaeon]
MPAAQAVMDNSQKVALSDWLKHLAPYRADGNRADWAIIPESDDNLPRLVVAGQEYVVQNIAITAAKWGNAHLTLVPDDYSLDILNYTTLDGVVSNPDLMDVLPSRNRIESIHEFWQNFADQLNSGHPHEVSRGELENLLNSRYFRRYLMQMNELGFLAGLDRSGPVAVNTSFFGSALRRVGLSGGLVLQDVTESQIVFRNYAVTNMSALEKIMFLPDNDSSRIAETWRKMFVADYRKIIDYLAPQGQIQFPSRKAMFAGAAGFAAVAITVLALDYCTARPSLPPALGGDTPTSTPTPTLTETPTPTNTPVITFTPAPSASAVIPAAAPPVAPPVITGTSTRTSTATSTATAYSTATGTATPSRVPPTSTATSTAIPGPKPSPAQSPPASQTIPAASTYTPVSTVTPSAVTVIATYTPSATITFTATSTYTPQPQTPAATATAYVTPTPPSTSTAVPTPAVQGIAPVFTVNHGGGWTADANRLPFSPYQNFSPDARRVSIDYLLPVVEASSREALMQIYPAGSSIEGSSQSARSLRDSLDGRLVNGELLGDGRTGLVLYPLKIGDKVVYMVTAVVTDDAGRLGKVNVPLAKPAFVGLAQRLGYGDYKLMPLR